jgi:hypothetical protein
MTSGRTSYESHHSDHLITFQSEGRSYAFYNRNMYHHQYTKLLMMTIKAASMQELSPEEASPHAR